MRNSDCSARAMPTQLNAKQSAAATIPYSLLITVTPFITLSSKTRRFVIVRRCPHHKPCAPRVRNIESYLRQRF